jgi:hypothetical protein
MLTIYVYFFSLEELLLPEGKVRFTCFMMTDGFGACFVFARSKSNKQTDPNVFVLDDFQANEVKEHLLPCAIDPGRRHVFTATIAHSPEELETRRCSSKERACYAGTL